MHLREYGYKSKSDSDRRLNAIRYAIEENDVQVVYERLVKLGKFNPVMKEDAERVAQIYELNVEAEAEAVVEAKAEAEAEAIVEEAVPPVVEKTSSDEWFLPASTWKALKPETDKGVKLQQSCKDAPKMVTELGDYGVQDNAHSRWQLLQDLADKHGIFAVLSLMATHLVTLTNPDQQKIMEGDMSALTTIYNEKMKAEGSPDAEKYWAGTAEVEADVKAYVEASAEASAEAEVEADADAEATAEAEPEVMEEKVLFLEMLDTKLADYKRQLSNLLDNENLDNNCILAFDNLRENMVAAYDEKVMKNKKIMEQKMEDFHKISKKIDKYRDNIVSITRNDEHKRYTLLHNMLIEMSYQNMPVIQEIKQCIVAVLKEQKQCDIVKVSELERKYQDVLQETGRLMKEIEGQVSRKGVAIKKCDLEGYDILVNAILENYKKVFAKYISALILDLRVKDAKHSISQIPSPDLFE